MAISVQRPVHFLVAVSVSLCVLQPPRLARLLLFLVIFVGIDRSCWPKKIHVCEGELGVLRHYFYGKITL